MLHAFKFPDLFIVTIIVWTTFRKITAWNFFARYRKLERHPYQFYVTDIWAAIAALIPSFFFVGLIFDFQHAPAWPEFGWIALLFVGQGIGIAIASMQLTYADNIDRTDRMHRVFCIIGGGIRGLGGIGIAFGVALWVIVALRR